MMDIGNHSDTGHVGNPLSEAEILQAVATQRDAAVGMLERLIAFGSLLGHEGPAQAHMQTVFADTGLRVHSFAIDEAKLKTHEAYSPSIVSYEGRPNVVGIHEPAGPAIGRSLILNGHIDVVPVGAEALWTRPPFEPWRDGDRLYGRGGCDMKAGIVANVMAMRALRSLGLEAAAPVYLQSVVEEECTGNGALACLIEGYSADAALIPEPLGGVMNGQLGVLWMAIEVLGVPVHAAYASTGVGAIEFAQYLVERVRELERRWNLPENRHPLFCDHAHPVNFNLGRISGGEWASSVSTQCRVDLRLGYYPGVKPAHVKAEVEALLERAHREHPASANVRYRVIYEGFQAEGVVVDMDEPVIQTLIQAHEDITGKTPVQQPFAGTTDVKFFHLYGNIPCTCYGPTGANIHGIDEWVSIDSLQEVTAVLALFIARWCGVNRIAG